MSAEAQLVLDAKAQLGEGALWHAPGQRLYWVDIDGCSVHEYDPATGRDRALPIGEKVGTVVTRARGGLMLAVESGLASFDLESERLALVATPEADIPENRFNDGKCDPSGRFWAGTMDGAHAPGRGALYRLDADMSVHRMVGDVSISNGLAWSLDRQVFYYIDSPTGVVVAYDYNDSAGTLSGRREVVKVPEELLSPDGMTIDSEGMLWVAHWGPGAVCRWNPNDGSLMERIDVPAAHTTSCAFGGEDLGDLYITTARADRTEEQLAAQPLSGGLFKARPGVTGLPAFEFAG
jgi:sugar lactone lactonase YvrE